MAMTAGERARYEEVCSSAILQLHLSRYQIVGKPIHHRITVANASSPSPPKLSGRVSALCFLSPFPSSPPLEPQPLNFAQIPVHVHMSLISCGYQIVLAFFHLSIRPLIMTVIHT